MYTKDFMKIYFSLLSLILVACNASKEETISPQRKNISIAVYASVTMQPKEYYNLYAENSGTIQKILVSENAIVQPGQTLAILKDQLVNYDVDIAKINRDLAEKNTSNNSDKLHNAKATIDILQNNFRLDSTNYERQKRLWAQKIGSAQNFEFSQSKFLNSKKQLETAINNYTQLKRELQSNYKAVNEQFLKTKNIQSNNAIKAITGGKVYQINKKIGEKILPQEAFCSIGNNHLFTIEMQIDEVDIAKIKLHQKTIVTLDAFPSKTFTAVVQKIYPTKNSRTQTFLVEATFTNAPKKLYAGLSGEANIIISEKKHVLTIPLEYLTPKKTVFTEDGEEIKVKTGLQNLEEVEILSGITLNSKIKKPL